MCNDVGEASRCCFFYSITGFVFTLWVGIMITFQPFYIAGLKDPGDARISAFGAMGMFLVTFLLSIIGMRYDSQNKKEDIDENNPENYQLNAGGAPAEYGSRYD